MNPELEYSGAIMADKKPNSIVGPIRDEKEVARLIVDGITAKEVDEVLVDQAVRQTVSNYETKLRVFAISVANRHVGRILRLLDTIDDLEQELSNPDRFADMESKDLLRLYTATQANLTSSLDFVKKVMDQRIELQHAESALISVRQNMVQSQDELPGLNPEQRDRVRRLIQGMANEIIEIEDDDEIEGEGQ